MKKTIRIGTFNCENLFARYKFRKNVVTSETISPNGWDINNTKFSEFTSESKELSGKAIKESKADVIALQEVENIEVLRRFRNKHLGGAKKYQHVALIDSQDPRHIDVGVISKYPIIHIRSYMYEKKSPTSRKYIFSRDCLEVDIDIDGTIITMFINHFKSMMGGRSATKKRRESQAEMVKKIVTNRFKNDTTSKYIICGDLNDYPDQHTSLTALTKWTKVKDAVKLLPKKDRWTHYYSREKTSTQLDYFFVSKNLIESVKRVDIIRKGLPKRALLYDGERFEGIGKNKPKASDHCPVVVEFEL